MIEYKIVLLYSAWRQLCLGLSEVDSIVKIDKRKGLSKDSSKNA
jgi:hypothetical protein